MSAPRQSAGSRWAARDRGQQTAALEELPLQTGSISLQPILDLSLQQKSNEHTNQLVRSPLDLAGLETGQDAACSELCGVNSV